MLYLWDIKICIECDPHTFFPIQIKMFGLMNIVQNIIGTLHLTIPKNPKPCSCIYGVARGNISWMLLYTANMCSNTTVKVQ